MSASPKKRAFFIIRPLLKNLPDRRIFLRTGPIYYILKGKKGKKNDKNNKKNAVTFDGNYDALRTRRMRRG